MMQRPVVQCGLDRLLCDPEALQSLRGARVGVLAHPSSVTRQFEHIIDALVALGIRPVRLFGPEHGLRGEAQDMVAVSGEVDSWTGIPTVSLYGHTEESLTPSEADLDGLDIVLVDLLDVGARYYTFVYTALLMVRACNRAGIAVWVLDRPNPLGDAVEGPTVATGFSSFVGMLPLPTRHGLTLAGVLRFAIGRGETLVFRTFEATGAPASAYYDALDVPWVLPSPNMPTLETAVVYPGQCLLEGTILSEGRGTTRPFELFGAPWIDAPRLRSAFQRLELPGVVSRLARFEPRFQKYAGVGCNGLQLHVTDRRTFRPVATSTALLWLLRQHHPQAFGWRDAAYEFVHDIPAIDLLFGTDALRLAIDGGATLDEVLALLQTPTWLVDAVAEAHRAPEPTDTTRSDP